MKERLLWILNLPAGLVCISWESCLIRCHLLQFWEIFPFRSQNVWCECRSLFPGVWQYKCWLAVPDRGPFQWDWRESFWNLFLQRTSPGWKVWCRRLLYPESLLWKDCLARAWLFLMEAVRSLKYWSISPFINCGATCLRCPAIMSSKGMDLDLEGPTSNAFGEGTWRVSTNFAKWVVFF